ncbi:S-methyl-5'-thioadenosine phosphorylase [Rhodococcus spelaei]|uniref:S-methyl-5'-thioadenosine phosphorylase n=1 Tax=Rhodococcus spelaei TaxID=2546320 RepID=A0A541B7K0_9NOCA|nr:S-methyl-5'-thioadenosine phosphorylase [Rhodococcus spelaei]TQF68302.1 S-methyl-5'-thioadenosine phosphorylase [Rhodococcus spelaei]
MATVSVPMRGPRPDVAVIGGSGFYAFFDGGTESVDIATPYGATSASIALGEVGGRRTAFLPRHGANHEHAPHTVPYRANMWALRSLGVRQVLAPCAAGSLTPDLARGTVVVPDQLVDRTSGRTQTYFDGGAVHVQFADPYCPSLRAAALQPGTVDGGAMVVVEGPRFSTRAESRWFAAQGWSLVNMTGHPEAVLARELEMCYATMALITDLDAGVAVGEGVRASEVFAEFERNIGPFKDLVRSSVAAAPKATECAHCRVHEGVTLPIELP